MYRVLNQIPAETLLTLRREPRLQVEAVLRTPETMWAYFPIRAGQVGDEHLNIQLDLLVQASKLTLRAKAEILLLLRTKMGRGENDPDVMGDMAHHFGHLSLYLRNPKAKNNCPDATRVWNRLAKAA